MFYFLYNLKIKHKSKKINNNLEGNTCNTLNRQKANFLNYICTNKQKKWMKDIKR